MQFSKYLTGCRDAELLRPGLFCRFTVMGAGDGRMFSSPVVDASAAFNVSWSPMRQRSLEKLVRFFRPVFWMINVSICTMVLATGSSSTDPPSGSFSTMMKLVTNCSLVRKVGASCAGMVENVVYSMVPAVPSAPATSGVFLGKGF